MFPLWCRRQSQETKLESCIRLSIAGLLKTPLKSSPHIPCSRKIQQVRANIKRNILWHDTTCTNISCNPVNEFLIGRGREWWMSTIDVADEIKEIKQQLAISRPFMIISTIKLHIKLRMWLREWWLAMIEDQSSSKRAIVAKINVVASPTDQ